MRESVMEIVICRSILRCRTANAQPIVCCGGRTSREKICNTLQTWVVASTSRTGNCRYRHGRQLRLVEHSGSVISHFISSYVNPTRNICGTRNADYTHQGTFTCGRRRNAFYYYGFVIAGYLFV